MTNHPNPADALNALTIDIDRSIAIRNLMIYIDDADAIAELDADAPRAIDIINSLDRETLTALLLADSLCPLHRIDYAICFDDDDAECRNIRIIHPAHDT